MIFQGGSRENKHTDLILLYSPHPQAARKGVPWGSKERGSTEANWRHVGTAR